MSIENQEPPKGKRIPNVLLGLSILSALPSLAIAFLVIYIVTHMGAGGGLAALPIIFIGLVAQCVLILPATLLVGFVYGRLSRWKQWPRLDRDTRFGVPLLVNILAASTILFIAAIFSSLAMFFH